jgi:signal transduction histidine kinase
MRRSAEFLRLLGVALLLVQVTGAGESAWDSHLARTFSDRLKTIDRELAQLAKQLEPLPKIPIDDQGGTGGYASFYPAAAPARNSSCAVEIRWPSSAMVELVVLVPARRYDARGLDAQYGTPRSFKVELLNATGDVLGCIAKERNTRDHPVRKGHPFVYQVSPPLTAAGLRISAEQLYPDTEEADSFVHAWAEVLAFEGERNLARGGKVTSLGGAAPSAPWHWNTGFIVDGQTPLGLPEIPAEEHRNIGWLSQGRTNANEAAALTVDLGESVMLDAVRLFPAKRPTSDLPSGFGFPRKLAIAVAETNDFKTLGRLPVVAERELPNPGHNPVVIAFGACRGRYVRIAATELWKTFESYPAFFALSEVEVLTGDTNLALGKAATSPDGMPNLLATSGCYWSSAALTDGFGPDGRLVSTREWITQLERRLQLETRCHELRGEAGQLVSRWRRAGLAGLTVAGLAGAFLLIALPIRYRVHARQELLKVRERIASDLHDEVGSNLGSIQMFADLAEGRSGPSADLKRIQRIAAETVSAVRDIVWLLRPHGEHRIGTLEHLRETSSIMLESLEWTFTANEEAWQVQLPEEDTRHLFLFFREALHNIMRHAQASKVAISIEMTATQFRLSIADNGVGIEPERLERPATLHALRQRAETLGAVLAIESQRGAGTRLSLSVPVAGKRRSKTKHSA